MVALFGVEYISAEDSVKIEMGPQTVRRLIT